MPNINFAEEPAELALNRSRKGFARILCPIDLSPDSYQSLWYGVGLASVFKAQLIIFHSAQGYLQYAGDSFRQIVQKTLALHVPPDRLNDLDWQCATCEGDAPESILNEAVARKADLIIMNSRRRAGVLGLIDSATEIVYRNSCCPVLVTHSIEKEWVDFSNFAVGINRLLVGYDYSPYSEIALAYASSLAQEFQAELHLMHVLPKLSDGKQSSSMRVKEAEQQLRDLINPEVFLWCDVQYKVREGSPCDELIGYAESNGIDLICMGAHGKEFGRWPNLGSIADSVVRQAPCPTFVARPFSYDSIRRNDERDGIMQYASPR